MGFSFSTVRGLGVDFAGGRTRFICGFNHIRQDHCALRPESFIQHQCAWCMLFLLAMLGILCPVANQPYHRRPEPSSFHLTGAYPPATFLRIIHSLDRPSCCLRRMASQDAHDIIDHGHDKSSLLLPCINSGLWDRRAELAFWVV